MFEIIAREIGVKQRQNERRENCSGIENARGTCLAIFVTILDEFISCVEGGMGMMTCERCQTWGRYPS